MTWQYDQCCWSIPSVVHDEFSQFRGDFTDSLDDVEATIDAKLWRSAANHQDIADLGSATCDQGDEWALNVVVATGGGRWSPAIVMQPQVRSAAPMRMQPMMPGTIVHRAGVTSPGAMATAPAVRIAVLPTPAAAAPRPALQPRPQRPHQQQPEPRAAAAEPRAAAGEGPLLPAVWAPRLECSGGGPESVLGGGAFAKILRAVDKLTGEAFAVKVMSRPNFSTRGIEAQLEAEIDAMRRCAEANRCSNVLRLLDTAEESGTVYLRLELCSCDLLRFAGAQPGGVLAEPEAALWGAQLMAGLRDIHALGVLHRDVKPENLLLTPGGTLKVADFGWCAYIRDSPCTLAGTFQYMAPEILEQRAVQTEAVDVWSAGVTLHQLLTGRRLLTTYLGPGATGLTATDPHQANHAKTARLLAEIREACPPKDSTKPPQTSSRCWDLLRCTLEPEVARRASVHDALLHEWLSPGRRASAEAAGTPPAPEAAAAKPAEPAEAPAPAAAAKPDASAPGPRDARQKLEEPAGAGAVGNMLRVPTPIRSRRHTTVLSPQPRPARLPDAPREEHARSQSPLRSSLQAKPKDRTRSVVLVTPGEASPGRHSAAVPPADPSSPRLRSRGSVLITSPLTTPRMQRSPSSTLFAPHTVPRSQARSRRATVAVGDFRAEAAEGAGQPWPATAEQLRACAEDAAGLPRRGDVSPPRRSMAAAEAESSPASRRTILPQPMPSGTQTAISSPHRTPAMTADVLSRSSPSDYLQSSMASSVPVGSGVVGAGGVVHRGVYFRPMVHVAPQQPHAAVHPLRQPAAPDRGAFQLRGPVLSDSGRRSPRLAFVQAGAAAPQHAALAHMHAALATPPAPCPVVYAPAQSPQQSPRLAMRTFRSSTFAASGV